MNVDLFNDGSALALLIFAWVFWSLGAKSEKKRLAKVERKQIESAETQLKKDLIDRLDKLRSQPVLLPSLVRWADQIDELFGEIEVKLLRIKKQPALKAAEKVAAAKRETREAKVEYELARNRVDLEVGQ